MSSGSDGAWDEIRLIQEGCLKIWSIYQSWFTWFFGAELVSMALLFEKEVKSDLFSFTAIGVLWVACSALGLIATQHVLEYSLGCLERIAALLPYDRNSRRSTKLLPRRVFVAAAWGNGLALSFGILAWLTLITNFKLAP